MRYLLSLKSILKVIGSATQLALLQAQGYDVIQGNNFSQLA